jgi:FtsZ-binding cell division protein ZapB
MLKTLQQEINERTESFDELRRRNKKLSPEQTQEIERLANDQGVLADLVRDLTRPKRDDGED